MSNFIKTFGCRLNTFETEIIKSFIETNKIKNLSVVNTCAVTQEAEKKAVAAEQRWHCALCKQLFQFYEVDHIEQFCIRGNNDRRNLQALCCDCHAIKTRKDREYGDALFEKRLERSSSLRGKNGNIFSKYFKNNEIKSSLESNARRFDDEDV